MTTFNEPTPKFGAKMWGPMRKNYGRSGAKISTLLLP